MTERNGNGKWPTAEKAIAASIGAVFVIVTGLMASNFSSMSEQIRVMGQEISRLTVALENESRRTSRTQAQFNELQRSMREIELRQASSANKFHMIEEVSRNTRDLRHEIQELRKVVAGKQEKM